MRNTNTNETENANKYIHTQRHIYFRHSVWKWKLAASEGRYDSALGVLLLYKYIRAVQALCRYYGIQEGCEAWRFRLLIYYYRCSTRFGLFLFETYVWLLSMSDWGASRMKRAQSIYRGQSGDVKMEMGR